MAVPGGDQRDWEFAHEFGLPIVEDGCRRRYFAGGVQRRRRGGQLRLPRTGSASRRRRRPSPGGWRPTAAGRPASSTSCGTGCSPGSGTGASRSRSCTTPTAVPTRCPNRRCRSNSPISPDYSPVLFDPDDADSEPSPPLGKATDWVHVELDLGDGLQAVHPRHQRHAAVGGQLVVRAALRRPAQLRRVLRQGERGVLDGSAAGRARRRRIRAASTCTSAASSTRCCICCTARFWHKVLYDLGHISSREPYPPAGQPGLHPGVRVHRLPRRLRARRRGRRARRQVLLARPRR